MRQLSRSYLQHGRRHQHGGTDDIPADWVTVGPTATAWTSGTSYSQGDEAQDGLVVYTCLVANTNKEPEVASDWWSFWRYTRPVFQNGWTNVGGTRVPMRFRYIPGTDTVTGDPGIEIQGAVTGGSLGTAIFTLPISLDYDKHLPATDDSGAFRPFTVLQSGDVVGGFV